LANNGEMDKFIAFTTVTVENELENKRENKEGVIRAGKMSEGMIFRDNSIIFLLLAMLKDNKGNPFPIFLSFFPFP